MRDRDEYVSKHPGPQTAAPEFICEDITAQYSSDPTQLRTMRRRRTTAERLEHLEEKYDRLVRATLDSRTKIIVAVVGAVSLAIGYLIGGCA